MRQLKILVVDDDPEFAEGVALSLEIAGHDVEIATSGEEAVGKFQAGDFDVTFMDVRMPGMNGVDSYCALRRIKPFARVVMMTAFYVGDQLRQILDQGARGVMHKPFTSDELLRTVDRVKPAGVVLLADDDRDFVEGIELTLVNADYTVTIARSGKEALDAVLAGGIDVLVLDLRLPVLDGGEVYRQLLENGRTVPTIVVTGYAAEESGALDALRAIPIDGELIKPFDTTQLLRSIDEIMAESENEGI